MASVGIAPPEKTAIIGRLPGYNNNIDSGRQFESQLLKGLTFIDLIPTSYKTAKSVAELFSYSGIKSLFGATGTPFTHMSGEKEPSDMFKSILKNMETGLNLDSSFSEIDMIRIVGANDSTFTENVASAWSGVNSMDSLGAAAKSATNKGDWMGKISNAVKSVNHQDAMKLFTDAKAGGATIEQIGKGAALGVTFARPSTWENSQYTSTLTMFIKLVSPSGHEECIKRNILAPVMYLLAASSPVTVHGFTYGFPMLWDVHAHGITRFKIGSIAAMTISRGSFETTFNTKFQPTVVDVRLTIVPLMQDFAVQVNGKNNGSMYKNSSNLGVQHPGDIYQGTMNTSGKQGTAGGDILPEVKIIQL